MTSSLCLSLITILIELVYKRLIQLIDTFFMILFLEIIFNLVIFNCKTFLSYSIWWLLTALLDNYLVLVLIHYALHFVKLKKCVWWAEIAWLSARFSYMLMWGGLSLVIVLRCFAQVANSLVGFIFDCMVDTNCWHGLILLQRFQSVLFWSKVPLFFLSWNQKLLLIL